MADFIPLSAPSITDLERRAVMQVLNGDRLSIGPVLEDFEMRVAARCNRTHGIGVNSGTSGLHLALLALGIGPGDEVITPTFSFVASANCIEYVGATPVFVDCDPVTLNCRPDVVERAITENTRAIIAVEVFGNAAGMSQLQQVAQQHEIPLIEDCCEGLGGSEKDTPVGHFGRVGVFGFYPNKQITTGEGGMIVTDDDRLADACRAMRNQGRLPQQRASQDEDEPAAELGSWLSHDILGYNYRLSEMAAAMGVAQMQRLDELLEARDRVASYYTLRLGGNPDIILPTVADNVRMSWFVFVVRLTDRFSQEDRDELLRGLRRHDVGCADYFPPIHLQPYYRRKYGHKSGQYRFAESAGQRSIALPFYPGLSEHDVDIVCQTLELMLTRQTLTRD